jgi:hypothetical protein
MKTYLIVVQLLLLTSCRAFSQYELKLPLTYDHHKVVYSLSIPQKYKLVKQMAQNAELQEVQVAAHLRDSSVIYITDDLKVGGGNDDYKIEKYGTHYELNNYIVNDTATLYGIHNGKYWREKKYYTIVVGYYNATADKVSEYNKIIDAIVPQGGCKINCVKV